MGDRAVEPDAVLFPAVPRVDADAVAASYHAWQRSFTEIRTDNELFNLAIDRLGGRPAAARQRGPGPGRALPGGRRPVVHDAVRARLDHRGVPGARGPAAARHRDARGPGPAPGDRGRPVARRRARQDPARAADRRDGPRRRDARTGPTTAPWTRRRCGSCSSGATWDWTGDRALIDRLWPNALRALEWIDKYGDRDGDGFVEYERRTPQGLLNQGWKDSHDGIRDRHGNLPSTPIALVEVQGYVYDAKRRMAALARVRGEGELAHRLDQEAETLRQRFEAAFWSEDQRFYAMALDGEKRQADAIGSNPGHCLWSGIVSPERAQAVVDRLMAPDMFSGWGMRTYAARPARLQPDRLPHGHGLAARRVADRGRLQALRLPRRGEPAGRPHLPGEPALRRLPAAGAVLRLRPRLDDGPGPVPGRLLAAGLGRGLRCSCSSRRCWACGRTPTAASWSSTARSCPTGWRRSP